MHHGCAAAIVSTSSTVFAALRRCSCLWFSGSICDTKGWARYVLALLNPILRTRVKYIIVIYYYTCSRCSSLHDWQFALAVLVGRPQGYSPVQSCFLTCYWIVIIRLKLFFTLTLFTAVSWLDFVFSRGQTGPHCKHPALSRCCKEGSAFSQLTLTFTNMI